MPLDGPDRIQRAWAFVHRPILTSVLRHDPRLDMDIGDELRRVKDVIQQAAVESGMGLFPEPGTRAEPGRDEMA